MLISLLGNVKSLLRRMNKGKYVQLLKDKNYIYDAYYFLKRKKKLSKSQNMKPFVLEILSYFSGYSRIFYKLQNFY